MTRCKQCSYNYQLKSSVYNQTGQCYEVQLAGYNAMTNHLHRILLAKSVVDSGKADNRLSRKFNRNLQGRAKTSICKRDMYAIRESPSQNLIDRLAYDTKHHPNEVANMSWRSCGRRDKGIPSNSTDSSEDSSLRDYPSCCKENYQAGCTSRKMNPRSSPCRRRLKGVSGGRKIYTTNFRTPLDNSGESEDFEEAIEKFAISDNGRERSDLKTSRSFTPCVTTGLKISSPGKSEFVRSLIGSTWSIDPDRLSSDVTMYVQFVYDITKEVVDRGYYSDHEIQRVFEKHIRRNLGRLNKKKMLREINFLKKALNMNYDDDSGDEGEDDAVCPARRSAPIGPLSPEKTDEMVRGQAALENRKTHSENAENKVEKNNPAEEIIVTRDDVLTTLLKMDLNREKAEEIYKSLENRSKEVIQRQENRSQEIESWCENTKNVSDLTGIGRDPGGPQPERDIEKQTDSATENLPQVKTNE